MTTTQRINQAAIACEHVANEAAFACEVYSNAMYYLNDAIAHNDAAGIDRENAHAIDQMGIAYDAIDEALRTCDRLIQALNEARNELDPGL